MGDASDYADVGRFMASREGKRRLKKFHESVAGKRIAAVGFSQHSAGVGITLILEDGDYIDLMDALAAFEVWTLRDRYVFERDAGDGGAAGANPEPCQEGRTPPGSTSL